MKEIALVRRVASIVCCLACFACSGEKSSTQSVKQVATADVPQPDVSPSVASGCDASLWNHVYDPSRLQQLTPCLSVTGIIDESSVDADGDQHFLLKLDPGQDKLLNKRNRKKKSGDIVLEIVCANPTTMKKAKSACAGYTNPIRIPAVGTHVVVTGTYVIDSNNGWAEIHPVSKLQAL